MEITLEEIQKKFETLPEDLQWAIMAANVDDNIIDIGKEQGLNVDQMGQLSLETHMVMFGFVHPDKFEESIKNSMGLPIDKTRAIVIAVNDKILRGIREKLIKLTSTPLEKREELPQNSKEDLAELSSHGIEIIPEKLELTPAEQNAAKLHTILSQKLSGSVQTPVIKTEHSLNNLTKSSIGGVPRAPTAPSSSVLGSIKPTSMTTNKTSPSFSARIDPYRELPQ